MRGSTSLKAEKGRSKPLPKWVKAPKKPQKGVEQRWDYDPTPMALAVALFGGACGLIVGDILHDSLTEGGAITLPWLPSWREHMALACFGVFSFVVSLFFLEVLSRRSKRKALKSTRSMAFGTFGDSRRNCKTINPVSTVTDRCIMHSMGISAYAGYSLVTATTNGQYIIPFAQTAPTASEIRGPSNQLCNWRAE